MGSVPGIRDDEMVSFVPSYGVTNSISSEPSATRMSALGIVFVCSRWELRRSWVLKTDVVVLLSSHCSNCDRD